jgi:hypothetical protein
MNATHDPQVYFHIRIVMGMIFGLAVTRILSGFAVFVQHPKGAGIAPLHLGWAAYILINAVFFWWWEYALASIPVWTFALYIFLILYTSFFYIICVLLFPDDLGEYRDYGDYLIGRRKWFFGIFGLSQVLDQIDTWIKGVDYALSLGVLSMVQTALVVAGCLIAMFTTNRRYHGIFLGLLLTSQMLWIVWLTGATP